MKATIRNMLMSFLPLFITPGCSIGTKSMGIGPTKSQSETRRWTVGDVKRIKVNIVNGDLRIIASTSDAIKATFTRKLPLYHIGDFNCDQQSHLQGDELDLALGKESNNDCRLQLEVPAGLAFELTSTNGEISIADIDTKELTITSKNGDVSITLNGAPQGKIVIKQNNGDGKLFLPVETACSINPNIHHGNYKSDFAASANPALFIDWTDLNGDVAISKS